MGIRESIITELGVTPDIDPVREIQQRVTFLAAYLGHTGLSGFVLGISGGQDSLLAGILAQKAVRLRREQGFQAEFHAVMLPYGEQADAADALLAIETIQPDEWHTHNIKAATDALTLEYKQDMDEALADFHKGNVKARMRMIAQYAIASQHNLLVLGTDHAAEAVTGFYTKFGDGAADVLPLAGLTKRQGRAMLQALDVPEVFITKKPTADLLDTKPGQTDEDELSLTYDQIDDYLEGKPVNPDVAATIEGYYQKTWHKRSLPVAYIGEQTTT